MTFPIRLCSICHLPYRPCRTPAEVAQVIWRSVEMVPDLNQIRAQLAMLAQEGQGSCSSCCLEAAGNLEPPPRPQVSGRLTLIRGGSAACWAGANGLTPEGDVEEPGNHPPGAA